MEGFQFLDILFLAMLAGFVLFRLWGVLGRRTGHERRPDPLPRTPPENGHALPPRASPPLAHAAARAQSGNGAYAAAPAGTPLAVALHAIRDADRGFDPETFVVGARAAHEMIAGAFAAGDRDSLRPLVDASIFAAFDKALRERETNGWKPDFSYVRLKTAEIVDAALKGRTAEVTLRFVVELMSGMRDASGAVVEGDPTLQRQVTDLWTFARDTRAGDPNWQLVATSGEA